MPASAKVFVQFPKTGLGNMLLVWANALVFAELNGFEMATSSWWGFHWGAILRGERKKRMYQDYFEETPLLKRISFAARKRRWQVVRNPLIAKLTLKPAKNTLYLFDEVITHEQLFLNLEPWRDLVCKRLFGMLRPSKKAALEKYSAPIIGMHIRRGDFKLANQTTSINFFTGALKLIRQEKHEDIPATIFSDAAPDELEEILQLPAVELSEDKADILDILLMSKSQVLVVSQSSTFSYWAAFLSEALVIMVHDDWQDGIRKNQQSGAYTECRFNEKDAVSRTALSELVLNYNLKKA